MPFQSEKQRRYMHANLPDIANRWEAKYGLGGIAELNSQLNDLPEYYIPAAQGGRIGFNSGSGKTYDDWLNYRLKVIAKGELPVPFKEWKKGDIKMNQGGFIPSPEAGIYGLEEGGRTGFRGGSPHDDSPTGSGSSSSGTGGSTSTSTSGGEGGYQNVHQTGAVTQTPGRTPTTTDDRDGRTQALINISKQKKRDIYGDADLEEQLVIDKRNALNRLKFDRNLTKNERQNLEVGLGLRSAKPKRSIWKKIGIGAAIITGVAPLLGFQAPASIQTVAQFNALHNKANSALATFNKINKTDHTLESLFSQVKNIETADKKLMESLPKGHPERIALEAKMKIKTPPKGPDGEGGDKVNITMDVEAVNDANADKAALEQKYQEMDEASLLAWQRQQELEAKKQAYLRNFRETYLSAQGGRVPGGYNTGGLSNLFRLKNV